MTLDEEIKAWVESHADEVMGAKEFTLCPLSDEPSLLVNQMSGAISLGARMGFILSAAESLLSQKEAEELERVIAEMPDTTPTERKIIVKGSTAELRRKRDDIKVLCESLKSLSIAVMNVRKTTFGGAVE